MRDLGGPRKGSGGWVVPGVAAAIGKLMDLGPGNIKDAIGLAEYFTPQAPQDRSASFPSHMKEGIPWAAYTGYITAFLSFNGFHGMRPHLIDSPFIKDLSIKYEIENVYFKRYACCRWAHPAIDGLEKMLKEKGCHAYEIDQIRIKTFDKAILLDRKDPSNTLEAIYSIPFAVGSYLIHGKLGPREVSGHFLQDSRIRDMSYRVQLVADSEFTKLFPTQCLQQIEVTFKDNTRYETDILSAKGDPENPLSYDEILFKFKMLSENIIGDRWQEVPKAIYVLEEIFASDLVNLLHLSGETPIIFP
jgi:2-methylcitrate dehydratase PrpD